MFKLIRGIVFIILIFVAALCGYIFYSIDKAVVNPPRQQLNNYISSDGNSGTFEKKETLNIFNLHGTYDDMGQQYGALAYNQLNEIYQTLVPQYFSRFSYKTVLAFMLRSYYDHQLDPRERDILQGMAKTSGLTYRQLLSVELVSVAMDVFNDRKVSGHCSFMGAWGKRSKSDTMIVARNLDLITEVGQLDKYNSLVIYNPTEYNNNSVASFGFIGLIPGYTMVNNRGQFFEINNGEWSVPGFNLTSGVSPINTGLSSLLDAKNQTDFIESFYAVPTMLSHISAVVDKNKAQVLERPAHNEPKLLDGQGADYLFFTNLYRTADFKNEKIGVNNCIEKVRDSSTYACVRYHNFEKLVASHNQFDINELKTFFHTSLDDGGIYQPGNSEKYPVKEITIHTVIGDLSTGEFIYSNHQNKDTWINLSLYKYFTAK